MENMIFKLISVDTTVPDVAVNEGVVIAFTPSQGFQSCRYYNGSRTWKSLITGQTVVVTHWLKQIQLPTAAKLKEIAETAATKAWTEGWTKQDYVEEGVKAALSILN